MKKTILFKDHPAFRPNLSPKEMFRRGIFGGTYFRPIYSHVTRKHYNGAWKEFPSTWFRGLDISKQVASPHCDKNVNKYKVTSGTSLRYWEQQGWIRRQDPYGWVQWYCRFYQGRRSPDDERQIRRWIHIADKNKGRWRKYLINKRRKSPVVQQLLLQWALEI